MALQDANAGIHAAAIPAPSSVTLRRGVLVLFAGAAVLGAAALPEAASAARADADLVRLMQGMAALKGLMVLGAVAALWWRFAQPVPARMAAGYVLCTAVMAAGVVLIWRLSHIGETALAFHAALFAILFLALKDDGARPVYASRR